MMRDGPGGQSAFERLLAEHPDDGILYLMRAEALEATADFGAALADYRRAAVLLPWEKWKQQARSGAERVEPRVGKQGVEAAPASVQTHEIGHRELGDLFNGLLILLGRIDPNPGDREELNERIRRLSVNKLVPRGITTHMHTIRINRNLAVKELQRFEGAEAQAIALAWLAVKEWAERAGHAIEDLP